MTGKQIEGIIKPLLGPYITDDRFEKAINKIMTLHNTAINKVRDKAKPHEEVKEERTYEDIMGKPLCPFRGNACSNTNDGKKGNCARCRVSEMYDD